MLVPSQVNGVWHSHAIAVWTLAGVKYWFAPSVTRSAVNQAAGVVPPVPLRTHDLDHS